MPIRQRHIDELKRLYKKHFGQRLADKQAWEMAHRLLNIFHLLIENQDKNAKETPLAADLASPVSTRTPKYSLHDQSLYEDDRDLCTKID